MSAIRKFLTLAAAPLLLVSCGQQSEGVLDIAFIADPVDLFADGSRLSSAAQHLRAATDAGLVTLNAQGEVVPALAESWIVTDDGLSFIFRVRETVLSDGTQITAKDIRDALQANIEALAGTSLALDLAPVQELRAMTERVIEVRLSSPVPDLLLLLAQPEMALRREVGGLGPMLVQRRDTLAELRFKPPEERGLPEEEDWQSFVRDVNLTATDAATALTMFEDGAVDVVLGGRLANMPLVDTGPLSRGTVQIDPALGLFGIMVRRNSGLLENEPLREALAMALDREALLSPFNVAGWTPTTRIVAPGLPAELPGTEGGAAERWQGLSIDQRRSEARSRIAAWRAANGMADVTLRLAIEEAPGMDMLYRGLAAQWQSIGIRLERAEDAASADLTVVDRVARYPDARWFLNQFHCSLRRGLCSADADELVAQARAEPVTDARVILLAEAEAQLARSNVYIPIASPLRWSLVRGSVNTFQANEWAFHPLPYLAQIPR